MTTENLKSKEYFDIGERIVLFIGPEGSSKSTVAKRLAPLTGKPYISTGDIIRDLARDDHGELGEACRKMFNEHVYLDGPTLLRIVKHRIGKDDAKGGFIMDGGMRTTEETENFHNMLIEAGRDLPLTIVHLRVPAWMGVERLLKRRRDDDTPEAIQKRLSKFYSELGKRVNIMEKEPNWKLIHIDATGTPEEVFENVRSDLTK
jgi:adenylate kinase